MKFLFVILIHLLACLPALSSDARLVGFWERTLTTDPGARWTLNADGSGKFEVDFGPPYPGFLNTSYLTWKTNASNTTFTYVVSRQAVTGPGPYTYDEEVTPPKTYSSPYTLSGAASNLWAIEQYSYAKAGGATVNWYDDNQTKYSISDLEERQDGGGDPVSLDFIWGIAIDDNGNIYTADPAGNRIRKITPDGRVSTFAGTGAAGNANGPGNQATFSNPKGIDFDADGNLYVADSSNHMIRKITPDGTVSTHAGSGAYGAADGVLTNASFASPSDVAVDGQGQIWVADTQNNKLRRIQTNGYVVGISSSGASVDTPPGGEAFGIGKPVVGGFSMPVTVAVSKSPYSGGYPDVYVGEYSKVRRYNGYIKTIAGAAAAGSNDGSTAEGVTARFQGIRDLAVDSDGTVLVADSGNNRIRRVWGVQTLTAAGSGQIGNVNGTAQSASFNSPQGVGIDPYGNLYVADAGNHKIRKGTPMNRGKSQAISFTPPATLNSDTPTFAFSASSSSGLPVTLLIVSGPATINSGFLTLDGLPGTVVIRAIQEGDEFHSAAKSVTRSVEVVLPYPDAPSITAGPSDTFTATGGRATFSVSATGANLVYQWYQGASGDTGHPIGGATNSTYTSQPLTIPESFWVRVSNPWGHANSHTAAVRLSSISAGSSYSMYLSPDGSAWAAGRFSAQLGLGDDSDLFWDYLPHQALTGVASVEAGVRTTFFLKTNGSLWAAGDNTYGILGDGSQAFSRYFLPVQIATDVSAIASGSEHSLRLKADGTVWASGANWDGCLGDGTTTMRYSPVKVMSGVKAISAAGTQSLFLKTDGSAWATGINGSGQLGDGTLISRSSPVKVMTGVSAISAGGEHALFLKTDGSVWFAGADYGAPLNGVNRAYHPVPVPVQGVTGATAISAGAEHSLVLKSDGTVWAWGINSSGQLADGTTASQAVPKQVLADAAAISAGVTHSLFIKKDGTFWAAGDRALGDGTNEFRYSPVQINLSSPLQPVTTPTDISLSSNSVDPEGVSDVLVGTLSTTDADSVAFKYRLVPGNGAGRNLSFSIVGNKLRANYPSTLKAGIHTVRIQSRDESGGTFEKAFAIRLVNEAPLALPTTVSTMEDKPAELVLNGNDPDGDILAYRIASYPAKGRLEGFAPKLKYIPDPDVSGQDSFTFHCDDGSSNSQTATVTVSIVPVNDPPVAKSFAVKTTRNKSVAVQLSGNDPEKSALKYSIIKGPKNGTLSGQAPAMTFKPKTNFTGSDSFTYRVNDGKLNSAAVTVSLTVKSLKNSPQASAGLLAAGSGTDHQDAAFPTGIVPSVPQGLPGGLDQEVLWNPLGFFPGDAPMSVSGRILSGMMGQRNFTYRYLSRNDRASAVSQQVQYSWNPHYGWRIAEDGRDGVIFTRVPLNQSIDEITVTLPANLGARFARVREIR